MTLHITLLILSGYPSSNDLSLHLLARPAGQNKLLLSILINEFPLTNMLLLFMVWCPHFILERTPLLAVCMLERTICVLAWVELAHDFAVSELAIWNGAISSITARWH